MTETAVSPSLPSSLYRPKTSGETGSPGQSTANTSLYATTANGAGVIQWAGNGSLDQQWQLVQVSGR